jgi:hypothetical protein
MNQVVLPSTGATIKPGPMITGSSRNGRSAMSSSLTSDGGAGSTVPSSPTSSRLAHAPAHGRQPPADPRVTHVQRRCAARPLDDRALVASRGWSRVSSSGSYGGTISTARTAGARLSLGKVVMTRGYLVATRCAGCGSVEVRVAGRLLGTVSLAAPATQRQVLIPLPGAGTTRVGQLVLRATSSRPVHVDGLAVGRS